MVTDDADALHRSHRLEIQRIRGLEEGAVSGWDTPSLTQLLDDGGIRFAEARWNASSTEYVLQSRNRFGQVAVHRNDSFLYL